MLNGINKKKLWEHANTGKFWNGLRTPDKRPSLDLALLFVENRLVSLTNGRGSCVVGTVRGSWVWVLM